MATTTETPRPDATVEAEAVAPPDAPAKHGGARKGAGRKPSALAPRNVARGPVLLTPTEAATLDARAAERGLSVQEAIRTALRLDGLID